MSGAGYYLKKARQCRKLLKTADEPEVAQQLRVWAEEFEHKAQVQAFGLHRPRLRRPSQRRPRSLTAV